MSFPDTPLNQTLQLRHPIWQAPLPFGVIEPQQSARISAAGALGMLRIGEDATSTQLTADLDSYRQIHEYPAVCFTHRLPQHQQFVPPQEHDALYQAAQRLGLNWPLKSGDHFLDLLNSVLNASPRAIGFANGVPEKETVDFIRSHGIFTFAICHSVAEALTAADFHIDCLVLQGVDAGGEQFRFNNTLPELRQSASALLQQVRPHTDLPLVLWGDFSHGADIVAALIAGAQAVMIERPFLQCVNEEWRDRLQRSNEYDSCCNPRYTLRPMRYLPPEAEIPLFPDLADDMREALMHQYFLRHPEQRPLPVGAGNNVLPDTLDTLLDTLDTQIRQLIG